MANAPATTVRIDPVLKNEANRVLDEIGISLSASITAFLKAVVREQGMPFEMRLTHSDQYIEPLRHCPGGNASLNLAGVAKRDEFFTALSDIEAELPNYKTEFAGKSILCNCDDPFESNFFKFFVLHFNEYGLKKLVATCYGSSPVAGRDYPLEKMLPANHVGRGYKAVITGIGDLVSSSSLNESTLRRLFSMPGNSIELLDGDGDFRSEECLSLLDRADIVVTNPPFSLFREYLRTLVSYSKKFVIIGNINAATYKEVFPLIKDNKVWFGASIHSGDRKFYVPDSYPLRAAGCGVDSNGRKFIRVKGVRWFTNIDISQRHVGLPLTRSYSPADYPTFENYNAINVSRTKSIPADYPGIMGVPITFLDKYDPNQFEIIMLANGNVSANTDESLLRMVGYKRNPIDKGGVGIIDGKRTYARVLIRNRHPRRAV